MSSSSQLFKPAQIQNSLTKDEKNKITQQIKNLIRKIVKKENLSEYLPHFVSIINYIQANQSFIQEKLDLIIQSHLMGLGNLKSFIITNGITDKNLDQWEKQMNEHVETLHRQVVATLQKSIFPNDEDKADEVANLFMDVIDDLEISAPWMTPKRQCVIL